MCQPIKEIDKLEIKHFYEIAKIVDSEFIGSIKSFTAERNKDYYYLTTNKCDNASFIKVYFNNGLLTEIMSLHEDTNGYELICQTSLNSVNKYLKNNLFREINH